MRLRNILIGAGVTLAGWIVASMFAYELGRQIYDHDTSVIVSSIAGFIGGILAGCIGALFAVWLEER